MTRPRPTFSVVIPAYGAVPWLRNCLEAVDAQDEQAAEVIVFHSGDGDPAAELRRDFPAVRFLHDDARHFAGAARNRGAAAARGDWLAFLDCDMRPQPGWLRALADAAIDHPDDVLAGSIGRMRHGGIWSVAIWFIECGSVLPHRRRTTMLSGPGANSALRRDLFLSSGGFRPDLIAAEDGELSVRLREAGHALRLAPSARADHLFPGGARHSLRRLFELGRAAAFLRRHRVLPGSAMVRHPHLLVAMPLLRAAQMVRRVVAERGPLAQLVLAMPFILVGLASWSIGFWREARRPTYPVLA